MNFFLFGLLLCAAVAAEPVFVLDRLEKSLLSANDTSITLYVKNDNGNTNATLGFASPTFDIGDAKFSCTPDKKNEIDGYEFYAAGCEILGTDTSQWIPDPSKTNVLLTVDKDTVDAKIYSVCGCDVLGCNNFQNIVSTSSTISFPLGVEPGADCPVTKRLVSVDGIEYADAAATNTATVTLKDVESAVWSINYYFGDHKFSSPPRSLCVVPTISVLPVAPNNNVLSADGDLVEYLYTDSLEITLGSKKDSVLCGGKILASRTQLLECDGGRKYSMSFKLKETKVLTCTLTDTVSVLGMEKVEKVSTHIFYPALLSMGDVSLLSSDAVASTNTYKIFVTMVPTLPQTTVVDYSVETIGSFCAIGSQITTDENKQTFFTMVCPTSPSHMSSVTASVKFQDPFTKLFNSFSARLAPTTETELGDVSVTLSLTGKGLAANNEFVASWKKTGGSECTYEISLTYDTTTLTLTSSEQNVVLGKFGELRGKEISGSVSAICKFGGNPNKTFSKTLCSTEPALSSFYCSSCSDVNGSKVVTSPRVELTVSVNSCVSSYTVSGGGAHIVTTSPWVTLDLPIGDNPLEANIFTATIVVDGVTFTKSEFSTVFSTPVTSTPTLLTQPEIFFNYNKKATTIPIRFTRVAGLFSGVSETKYQLRVKPSTGNTYTLMETKSVSTDNNGDEDVFDVDFNKLTKPEIYLYYVSAVGYDRKEYNSAVHTLYLVTGDRDHAAPPTARTPSANQTSTALGIHFAWTTPIATLTAKLTAIDTGYIKLEYEEESVYNQIGFTDKPITLDLATSEYTLKEKFKVATTYVWRVSAVLGKYGAAPTIFASEVSSFTTLPGDCDVLTCNGGTCDRRTGLCECRGGRSGVNCEITYPGVSIFVIVFSAVISVVGCIITFFLHNGPKSKSTDGKLKTVSKANDD